MPITIPSISRPRAIAIVGSLLLAASVQFAAAAGGPFNAFPGEWSGTGKIQVKGQDTERLRCKASYQPRGSSGAIIKLRLSCDSDSYKFDLVGDFEADADNRISGRWSENSRNVGGTAVGSVRNDRFQLHVESSAFAADMTMTTRGTRQAVSFDAQGGGQVVTASITLSRR